MDYYLCCKSKRDLASLVRVVAPMHMLGICKSRGTGMAEIYGGTGVMLVTELKWAEEYFQSKARDYVVNENGQSAVDAFEACKSGLLHEISVLLDGKEFFDFSAAESFLRKKLPQTHCSILIHNCLMELLKREHIVFDPMTGIFVCQRINDAQIEMVYDILHTYQAQNGGTLGIFTPDDAKNGDFCGNLPDGESCKPFFADVIDRIDFQINQDNLELYVC